MKRAVGKPQRNVLTLKQQQFCRAYIENNGNGVQAAREAGYKGRDETLRAVASENLTKPNIKEFIARLTTEADRSPLYSVMCRMEVLLRTSILARASLDDLLDEKGRFDLAKARHTGAIYAIKRLSFYRSGKVKSVELRDKNGSAELLGKHHGLWTGEIEDLDEMLAHALNIAKHRLSASSEEKPFVPGEIAENGAGS